MFSTFIKLPFVIKIFALSIFEWLFYTGFIVRDKYPQYSVLVLIFHFTINLLLLKTIQFDKPIIVQDSTI